MVSLVLVHITVTELGLTYSYHSSSELTDHIRFRLHLRRQDDSKACLLGPSLCQSA